MKSIDIAAVRSVIHPANHACISSPVTEVLNEVLSGRNINANIWCSILN